jgi:hypothetical protein
LGEPGDLFGWGPFLAGCLQLCLIHAGQDGDGKKLWWVGNPGEGLAGSGEHGGATASMQGQHAHTQRGSGAHGACHGVRNVVKLEVEEDGVSAGDDLFNDGGA